MIHSMMKRIFFALSDLLSVDKINRKADIQYCKLADWNYLWVTCSEFNNLKINQGYYMYVHCTWRCKDNCNIHSLLQVVKIIHK